MRISTMMIFDNMLSNLTKAIERTQNIQEVISTGKKINLLSDDPAGIVQVVNYQSDLTKLSQYKENITHGNSWLDMSDSILQDIQNLVGEAKNIAIAQSTSTMNSETRAQAAVVAQNLYEQLIGYGNTRLAGRYIFGGSITDRAPFNANGTYNGNGEDILVEIIEGIQAKINLAGSEFLVTDLNPDLSTAAATSGSTSSTGLTARNINAVLTNPGGSSEYKATFVLTNGLTQEVTYTTDSTPTREELGAGIADAVNNHYTLNQYIRASYDTTTGNITFEAKEAGTEGNQYTIDAANTTAFEGTVNTSFAGGSSEVTSGFVFVGGTNSSIVFRENAGLDINADIITDGGAVSGEVYTGDQVASFIEQSMESKSQTDPNGNSYTYTVSYNETTNLFAIENDATNGGGLGTLTMRWSALNDIGTA
ncbi:MAG: flagellar hook-associated protein FlgL, partial [Deltaproteobacteria bacterium]|nr:flagellar hook-associated protein FlgL [Deltaproteobacteria bacterium]